MPLAVVLMLGWGAALGYMHLSLIYLVSTAAILGALSLWWDRHIQKRALAMAYGPDARTPWTSWRAWVGWLTLFALMFVVMLLSGGATYFLAAALHRL